MEQIFKGNADWSEKTTQEDPEFFTRLAGIQRPRYFWIGCSDSRVPANQVAGLQPGEVFVHRNVANVVHSSDLSLLSALEFAIEALGVRDVIVCGHYGCGGVIASMQNDHSHSLAQHWIEPIRRLNLANRSDLEALGDHDVQADRLAELNVLQGVHRVSETPIIRRAWAQGNNVEIHGLIYGLKDGRIRNLECSMSAPK